MPLPRKEHFRDVKHYLAAAASELAAPALRIGARAMSRTSPGSPDTWRRILIVGHGHIGDVLCQTVSLESLAHTLASCAIDYLTTPLAAQVLEGNPALRETLPWNSAPRPDAVEPAAMRALRDRRYDAVLCTNVVRHHEALRLALRLGIPNRVAFVHRGLSGLVTLPVHLERPMTPPAQSRRMLETVTGRSDDTELRPHVYPTAADRQAAEAELNRLGIERNDIVIACSVTTRQVIGRIPEEFFLRVLRHVQNMRPDAKVVLCGSSADNASLQQIAAVLNGARVSAGVLNLRAFTVFLQRADVFFGMDSGPRHLANAAGTPVIFVRNMAVREAEAGAYCPTEVDVAPAGDFLDESAIRTIVAAMDADGIAAQIVATASATHYRAQR